MYRVLVVDDEPYVIEGLRLMIDWEKYGFEIADTAMSGTEALEKFNASVHDLVVIDVCMPETDGLSVIEEVKRQGYRGGIIVLTGYTEVDYARRAMSLGVKYFLNKPLDTEEFDEVLVEIKKELECRDKLKGDIAVKDGLAAAKRHRLLRGDSDAAGVLVVYSEDNAIDENALPESAYIYENYKNYTILLINGDFPSESERAFEALKRLNSDIIGARKASEGESIEECCKGALDSLRYRISPEKGTMYDYSNTADTLINPLDISDYADRVIAETELCNTKNAYKTIDDFFAIIEASAKPENYTMLFVSYMIVRINKLIIRYGGNPDKVIGSRLKFENESLIGLAGYRDALKDICAVTIECQREHKRENDGEIFEVVESYIKEHFREHIVIQDIAKQMYTSPGYLGTLFSKKVGVSIKEYIHTMRMEEAVRLMNETDLSLNDIAYKVGYNNYNNFYNRFERFFGMSPKKCRKSL